MKKDKFFIIGIVLGVLFIVAGITTFFVIRAMTPKFIAVKANEDVSKYYTEMDDKNRKEYEQKLYYFEDFFSKTSDYEFKIETNKIANDNASYSKFRITLSLEIETLSGSTLVEDDVKDTSFVFSANEKVIGEKTPNTIIKISDYDFKKDSNEVLTFKLKSTANADLKVKFKYSTLKMLVLGE